MSLALATLIYEWRRYLAAVIALAFCGMMVMAFSGMFAGIIHTEFATWERSRADLIILPANVKSLVNSNASLPARVKPQIYLHPEVVDVEELGGDGAQLVNIAEAWPEAGAALRADLLGRADRGLGDDAVRPRRGRAPGADGAGRDRDRRQQPCPARRQGRRQGRRSTATRSGCARRSHGYQSPEQPVVITSRETVRLMGMDQEGLRIGPLMVKIRDPKRADIVRDQLNAMAQRRLLGPDHEAVQSGQRDRR